MILSLDVERLHTLDQVRAFLDGNEPVDFKHRSREEAYAFVQRMLARFGYARLGKADKGALKRFLGKTTGLSRAQLTRLVHQYLATGRIVDRRGGPPARPFGRRYTAADIRLLADVDATLGQMAGPATREVMRREHEVFGDERFARLAGISVSHLYNLRASITYRRKRTTPDLTRAVQVAIAERRRPRPEGRPGFLRVDTVHACTPSTLGDLDGSKGVYLVNTVDEVTQYEFVGAVPAISERFLVPVLEGILGLFPFAILGFHADNASRRDAPAPSTSTARSPGCSPSCTPSSPSPAPAAPTTTRWSRGRTPTSCAAGSATRTSRGASRRWSTSSRRASSRRPSTSTGPACSPSSTSTRRGACAADTLTTRSSRPTTACAASTAPSASSSPASPSPTSTAPPMRSATSPPCAR